MAGLPGNRAGPTYELVDSPGLYKESYEDPSSYYDPQGRSGARYQASRQQAYSEGPPVVAKSSKKKWVFGVAAAIIAIAVIVGVSVGVTMAKKNSNKSNVNAASGVSTSGVNGTTSSNGTSYANDTRLHNSFYGIAYTPQVGFE